MRTVSPAERGCCRQQSVYINVDQNETQAEGTDQAVRTSFPAIGQGCGLRGKKEHFPTERERGCTTSQHIESRHGEGPRPARADGKIGMSTTATDEQHIEAFA